GGELGIRRHRHHHLLPPAGMDRGGGGGDASVAALLLPSAPMAYAVVTDPGTVDTPDMPSYQPYVYGRLDPLR
ncbi:Os11g0115800, partial [Oryza sativa Japonica Group]